jgi:hypothetical protein
VRQSVAARILLVLHLSEGAHQPLDLGSQLRKLIERVLIARALGGVLEICGLGRRRRGLLVLGLLRRVRALPAMHPVPVHPVKMMV